MHVVRGERRERSGELPHDIRSPGPRADAEPERPRAPRVGLDRGHVLCELGRVRLGVGLPSAQAVLFVGEEHRSNRALRLQAQGPDQPDRLHRDRASGAVILRARSDVPRVQVSSDHDELVGLLGSLDLADHISGLRIGEGLARHRERDPNSVACNEKPLDQLGVLRRDRRRRNMGDAVFVPHRARMGKPQVGRREGADHHADRPYLRGRGGPGKPQPDGGSVPAIVAAVRVDPLVVEDDLPLGLVAQRFDLVEARHLDDLSGDSVRSGPVAHAERQDRHRMRHGGQDPAARVAANPVRHHRLLGADQVEAVALHLLHAPADRLLEILGAGEARTDAVGEPRQLAVGTVASESRVDDPLHRVGLGRSEQREHEACEHGDRNEVLHRSRMLTSTAEDPR